MKMRAFWTLAILLAAALPAFGQQIWVNNIPAGADKAVKGLSKSSIKWLAFTPDGSGYVVLFDKNGFVCDKVPSKFKKRLGELQKAGMEIKSVSFAPKGGSVILYNQHDFWCDQMSDEVADKLRYFNKASKNVKSVTFPLDGSGCLILYDDKGYWGYSMPVNITDKLADLYKNSKTFNSVAIAPNGAVCIIYDDKTFWAQGLPIGAGAQIRNLAATSKISQFSFTPDGKGCAIIHGK